MPSASATCCATGCASPVSRVTCLPSSRNFRINGAASGRMVSAKRNKASQPVSSPKATTVSVQSTKPRTLSGKGRPCRSATNSARPIRKRRPSRSACMPLPGVFAASLNPSCRRSRLVAAASRKACPSGCSDARSIAAASEMHISRLSPPSGSTSTKRIRPKVNVPVLSKTKCVACASVSMACPRVTSTPRRASVPAAMVNATGVARESAHGQATTSTDTVTHSARDGSTIHQSTATTSVMPSKAVRKPEATRSASSTSFGFSEAARSIRRKIAAKRVASPTCSTRR